MTNPLPVRERILNALQSRVGASRSLDSYDERDLPITLMSEGEDQGTRDTYGKVNVSLPVTIARAALIEGPKGDDWHAAANQALAELIREVYVGGEDLGGLTKGIDYEGGTIGPLTDGSRGYMVQAFFSVRYVFLHGNPFVQSEDEE
jgi:hypothetical protein